MSKKKKNKTSKEAWVKYLKDSKLSAWEVQRRSEWYAFHKDKVPQGDAPND